MTIFINLGLLRVKIEFSLLNLDKYVLPLFQQIINQKSKYLINQLFFFCQSSSTLSFFYIILLLNHFSQLQRKIVILF